VNKTGLFGQKKWSVIKYNSMRLFRRKPGKELNNHGIACVHCGSTDTFAQSGVLLEDSSAIKVWRGERYIAFKCRSCRRVFYSDKNAEPDKELKHTPLVEDEDKLHAAEEELKRQTDAGGDHRYLP
jgi:hypothetical protein